MLKIRIKSTAETDRVNRIRYELQGLEPNLYLFDNDIDYHGQPAHFTLDRLDYIKKLVEEHFSLSRTEQHLERLGVLPVAYETIV